jgi:hypothetical protein
MLVYASADTYPRLVFRAFSSAWDLALYIPGSCGLLDYSPFMPGFQLRAKTLLLSMERRRGPIPIPEINKKLGGIEPLSLFGY